MIVEQNKQYRHLIVLYPEDVNEGSHPRKMWTCKCACGNGILLYRISFWDHSKFEELRERFSWN